MNIYFYFYQFRVFNVIWRDLLNSEFLNVWFCFKFRNVSEKIMVLNLDINYILCYQFPMKLLFNKQFTKRTIAYELWPRFSISNFATKISPFFGFSWGRNQNAKSHLDLSYLIREKLSVDFCFPLDFSSCFIGGVTSIHWTRVWDFYFIFHWTGFLVLVIKMTPTIWRYLGYLSLFC